ncbi:MAG: hypothetical protein FJ363_11040 [Gemmatimonadetes bacterium]|nr:hypothetical protein [Gemmatimonadota bacterium]
MRFRLTLPFAIGLSLAGVAPAGAQRALGIGGDAATLPAGMLRVGVGPIWERANERHDADGKLRPLGAASSPAAWNGQYDARLAAAQPLVHALSGVSSFDASLGRLLIERRDAAADAALGVELGVTRRLMMGLHLRVANHAIEPAVTLNPGRVEGTMGLNPAWTNTAARDRNTLVLAQFDSAVAQTGRRITQCQASPSTAGCAPILSNVAGAQSLVSNAASFAGQLNALYGGRKNAVGLPFVPVANTAAQTAIAQRMLGYRDQFAVLGNSAIGTQGPAAAALLSPADLTALLTDSLYGYRQRPLRAVHAYGLGDVTVSAKARVFDLLPGDTARIRGFAIRQAVAASLRMVGGDAPAADEVFAPMAGEGGGALALQSFTDLFYGDRWSATVTLGYERPQERAYDARVPAASTPAVGDAPFPFVAADRTVRLTRAPGSRLDVAITPRVSLTRNIRLGATWTYAQQEADTWRVDASGASTLPDGAAEDAAAWAGMTDWSEQRLSIGGTYSTVEATRTGEARLAFDVTYEHQQTLSGSGARVPHLSRDAVIVRWYPRLWGRH